MSQFQNFVFVRVYKMSRWCKNAWKTKTLQIMWMSHTN